MFDDESMPGRFMLSIKFIYAYWQTYFCFLSNVRLFTIKYIRFL